MNNAEKEFAQESGLSSIELTKTSANKYGWKIKVYGVPGGTIQNILDDVQMANERMLQTYGFTKETEKSEEKVNAVSIPEADN